ncbi:MAG: preprotein translocase subunit YajC [Flavobacteriales bacterium]|jgi:preprotein translocase subunit YajC
MKFSLLADSQPDYSFPIMMILMFAVVWFFILRPQKKKQKELEEQRKQIQKGDTVITAGGIYGKIITLDEETVIIATEDGSKLKVTRTSVFLDIADVNTEVKND